jgi:hypothetical protein
MNGKAKVILAVALVVGLAIGLAGGTMFRGQAVAQAPAKAAGAHYTVVQTEGHNLIVTDNQSNTLYFYTIDPDAELGSDLKLRGKVDLSQVGKDVIKPTVYFKKGKGR